MPRKQQHVQQLVIIVTQSSRSQQVLLHNSKCKPATGRSLSDAVDVVMFWLVQ
jgi:hypothetical protein